MNFTSNFISSNGLRLHYLDYPNPGPTVVLMHGLTANAHAFDGLIAAGLNANYRIISVDLRGRGLTDKPLTGYTIFNHAKDILGLLDHLQIEEAFIGGHSFGGLLTIYLAKYFPERVEKMILLDAAARMHPNASLMLRPAMSRLGKKFPSFEAYLDMVKNTPYNTIWEESMVSYYRADVKDFADGSVKPRSRPGNITEAVMNILSQPWPVYLSSIHKPALLIIAHGIKYCDSNLGKGYGPLILELESSLAQINVVSGKLNSIEDELNIRYKDRLNSKVELSQSEVNELKEIEKLTRTITGRVKKYSGEPEGSVKLVLSMIETTFWAGKNEKPRSWIDLYIQEKPVYSAILHIQFYRTSLYQLKQYLKSIVQMKMYPNGGFDRLYSNYRLLKDTLNPGEPVKAILFLGFTRPTFACSGNSYPYPKAFLFNGKKYPVSYDPETGDVVANIKFQLPQSNEERPAAGIKSWTGKWVIAISPDKDTIIAAKGNYILK